MKASYKAVLFFLFFATRVVAQQPLFRIVDIDVGATEHVQLSDGKHATVKLLSISETRDKARSAIREARAEVQIDGTRSTLPCGNYRLPVTVGEVQVDCTVTKAYYQNTDRDHWGLEKDARLRLWPAGSPFMPKGSMVYPVRQRWFVTHSLRDPQPAGLRQTRHPGRVCVLVGSLPTAVQVAPDRRRAASPGGPGERNGDSGWVAVVE